MKLQRGFLGAALLSTLLVGVFSGSVNAQVQGPLLGGEPQIGVLDQVTFSHSAVERWRRVDAFRLAWDGASAADRARVREVLQSLRGRGAPSEWWPGLGSIEVATRILLGQDGKAFLAESKSGALAVQAAALDLRVVPGAFEARAEGRTASLVVRVSPLFELREALDVQLSLIWISPEGGETLARSEAVTASAFRAPGFEMYIRAPHTGPGIWRLVAELAPASGVTLEDLQEGTDDAAPYGSRGTGAMLLNSVRSKPIPVPALLDPVGELARERGFAAERKSSGAALALGDVAAWNRPVLALDRLLAEGLRLSPLGAIPFADYWRARAGSAEHNWTARLKERQAQAALTLRALPDFGCRLLRVSPSTQVGGDLDAGFTTIQWGTLGRIFNVSSSKDGVDAKIGQALQELKSADSVDRKRVLILRGDALMAAQLESLRHGQFDVDYMVIVANSWRPTPIFPTVPTLFLSPNEVVGNIAAAAKHVTAKTLPDSVFLSELVVPDLIAEWLAEQGFLDSDQEPK